MVAKLPKDRNPKVNTIEEMSKDIEASLVCSIIVEGFNVKLESLKDHRYK